MKCFKNILKDTTDGLRREIRLLKFLMPHVLTFGGGAKEFPASIGVLFVVCSLYNFYFTKSHKTVNIHKEDRIVCQDIPGLHRKKIF